MSLLWWGLAQGVQLAIEMLMGNRTGHVRRNYRSLAPRGKQNVRGVTGGRRADSKDFVEACLIARTIRLEDVGVEPSIRVLADSGGHIQHPRPTTYHESGELMQRVGMGGCSPVHVGDHEGMVLANDVEPVLLAV